jgi:hypothetical protein
MKPLSTKQLATNLLKRLERVSLENAALKKMLLYLPDDYFEQNWEETMNLLLADRDFCEPLHARIVELRKAFFLQYDLEMAYLIHPKRLKTGEKPN